MSSSLAYDDMTRAVIGEAQGMKVTQSEGA